MSLISPRLYFTIHNFTSPMNSDDGVLVYLSINEDHAKSTFAKLIDKGRRMGLTYLKLERVETDEDGLVIHKDVIRAGWVRGATGHPF